ncbi:MAG: DHH family phosphoesterase, partial [Christensenellales bacterium]
MQLKKTYDELDNDVINEAKSKFCLPATLINYVYNLGYNTIEKMQNYFYPTKEINFYNPFLFPNMDKICERIRLAVKNGEHILIFGDYDADGIGSTAILYKYFLSIGVIVDYFLPSRYYDGYGLTIDSINKVKDLYKPDLIITVD